jgi:hypothetical protein
MMDRRVPGPQREETLWTCPEGDFKLRAAKRPKCPSHPDKKMIAKKARKR